MEPANAVGASQNPGPGIQLVRFRASSIHFARRLHQMVSQNGLTPGAGHRAVERRRTNLPIGREQVFGIIWNKGLAVPEVFHENR
jgi:hypothetical protein